MCSQASRAGFVSHERLRDRLLQAAVVEDPRLRAGVAVIEMHPQGAAARAPCPDLLPDDGAPAAGAVQDKRRHQPVVFNAHVATLDLDLDSEQPAYQGSQAHGEGSPETHA